MEPLRTTPIPTPEPVTREPVTREPYIRPTRQSKNDDGIELPEFFQ